MLTKVGGPIVCTFWEKLVKQEYKKKLVFDQMTLIKVKFMPVNIFSHAYYNW